MAIHTSSIIYTRGIPKRYMYNNFFLVAQTNNTIPVPMHKYLARYSFYNRNITNTSNRRNTFPWNT
jgi:hypothetical protein